MSANQTPAPRTPLRGAGRILITVLIAALILVPAALLAAGVWWVQLILAAILWALVIWSRPWRS